ncbi:class I SAM-dependent methyltransferase [Spartinivicinus poritis]|uniref:Class I SAM-dependent methyltransferase n=1 Tax=Spartinivicinus poritis TaxID=2994640 RepID=A0ABT5UHP3_9GAMM|nr:class I SAM-dependent methyltransferase [Spartinivicinus sp. A2-2]MDE1465890.1 class I SAM-dependent methyltransferase [Spartinivicinus sp. A2-2]
MNTLSSLASATAIKAYDIVGQYNQDRINGFSDYFLDAFIDMLQLESAANVLDAMGGNGNLTHRMINYCVTHNIELPTFTLLEYSSVQTNLARSTLHKDNVYIVNGDVLTMTDLESGKQLPKASFDRVVIKSGNHEIPLKNQHQLYYSVFKALKPGGLFINLGFLFTDSQERKEFTKITNVKDKLIGAMDAVANRYFLLKDEFYDLLTQVGFKTIECNTTFEYTICSKTAEKEYFSNASHAMDDILAAQRQAKTLLKHQRIQLNDVGSTMYLPGEITIATKPY